jgi:hypothetical protein
LICVAGDWPAWRGPRGDGRSEESGIPTRWSQTENVAWKVALPGRGHSSPIVWGDRVFVTACDESKQSRILLCLDRTSGKVIWEREVLRARLEPKHDLNSYASSTPATDGTHIWVTFANHPRMEVHCFDFAGNRVWQKSPGEFHSRHGFCSPPILYRDLVIVNGDQDALAFIVAFEKTTGAERWRIDRPNRTRSYVPPLLIHAAGKDQLVVSGSKCVASYDPADGEIFWIVDGPTEQFVASPVFSKGIVCITAGYPEYHLIGIQPDGSGNVTKSHVRWHERRGAAYVPSPIADDAHFYIVSDRNTSDKGVLTCVDAVSGKRIGSEKIGANFSASPVSAGGHLYFLDDEGMTHVIKAGPRLEVVARNPLGEPCRASPAIANGQIFIRAEKHLYCIGTPK